MAQPTSSFRASLLAMLGICLVFLLASLDSSMVGTAMPRVVAELQGYDFYTWPASAYLLFNAVTIPITGRLGDLHGRKYFVVGAIVVFTLSSVLCGMAQSMPQLIAARGLQGVGGGMLFGVASASVSDLFPDRNQRIRWQVMLTATYALATAVGPSMAGWLTEYAGWRSIFYVNAPLGLLALFAVLRFLPRVTHNTGPDRSVDWSSTLLMGLTVSSALLAAQYASGRSFGLLPLGALVSLAAATGVLFVRHQHKSKTPIIPPRMFKNRTAMRLMSLSILTGFGMFLLIYYAPLFLQAGLGMAPNEAGLALTPLLLMLAIGTFLNGQLTSRLKRPEQVILLGQVLLILGCLLLIAAAGAAPYRSLVVGGFALCGLALGFQMPSLILQMHVAVEPRDMGVGMSLVQTARLVGSMVGISVGGFIINRSFSSGMQAILEAAHLEIPAISELFQTPQVLVRVTDQSALANLEQPMNFSATDLLQQAHEVFLRGMRLAWVACCASTVVAFLLAMKLRSPQPSTVESARRPRDEPA